MSFVDRYQQICADLAEVEREIDFINTQKEIGGAVDFDRVEELLAELDALQDELAVFTAEALYAASDEATATTVLKSDISHEESRVYAYPDGDEVEVEAPQTLYNNVETGEHWIVDVANVGTVVRPGWNDITIYPRAGEQPFKFVA